MRAGTFFIIFSFFTASASAQARLVLNGAFINIENGARLVVDNPDANAVTRLSGGHIISENENDIVRWNIRDNDASYTVPFGLGTSEYLPLSFTTNNASGSNGYIEFATYGGPNYLNSSYLPSGVLNFTGFSGPDNSPYVMDRFWLIRARGYANGNDLRPELVNLRLTYRDPEHTAVGNIIDENRIWIQRYNPVLNTWYDYIPGNGVVAINTAANTVQAGIVPNDEVFDWWVIVDQISPLPVELLTFTAEPVDNKHIGLSWETNREENSDKFIVERSRDGISWEHVLTKAAAGNSAVPVKYTDIDPSPLMGQSYYRLQQLDLDGSFKYSSVISVFLSSEGQIATLLYPNPTAKTIFLQTKGAVEGSHRISVFDANGRLVMTRDVSAADLIGSVPINVEHLAQGTYFLQIIGAAAPVQAYKFVKI